MVLKSFKIRFNRLMGKNLMIMLPFTRYLRFLRALKFTRGYWPRVIFGVLRIAKNRVILVFIIATLPVNLLQILFTRFLTAFYTDLIFCAKQMFFSLTCFWWATKMNVFWFHGRILERWKRISLWKEYSWLSEWGMRPLNFEHSQRIRTTDAWNKT